MRWPVLGSESDWDVDGQFVFVTVCFRCRTQVSDWDVDGQFVFVTVIAFVVGHRFQTGYPFAP